MKKLNKTVSKILFSGILLSLLLLVGSCENWMSNDNFMEQIESEVHDANAAQVSVYVRYANAKMGTTEPQGNFTMKVDVPSKISAVTSDDYGFVKWAAFSQTDFPSDKQHSKLTFLSEDDYNENYKSKELPASVIEFTDVKNPVTEVKVKTSRNDIFIIPIVTSRPSYSLSVPANADSNVVKNTSIRILFTKPIDKNTIFDSEGNLNISITSSNAVFTDDDSEMEANDITDLFDIGPESFSKTGKMLTLKLKEGALFDNRQRITVTLLEGLCDLYGFAMNGNYTFQFQTGTSSDDLAPMIEVLYGGTGDICDVFITFGEDGEMKGTATDEAKKAPKDINSDKYTNQIVAQRVYDKLNIFVKANDIINSGNAVINPAKDLSEDNVALIYIAAGLYIDSNGDPITIDENNSTTHQIGKKSYTYISGSIDPNAEIQGQFTDLVPVDKDGNAYNSGTIYTYDVSNLPDGLIRIDVWAGDMTGNAGGPNDKGAPYYDKHDNSFKSIFIVKDTTPIDSAEVKAKKQVKSNSAQAPYYWYNLNTLNSMELFDLPENKIHDAGHEKLRALDKNLWWTFKVGNISEKVLANDANWKRIHDEETGNTSLHYSLSGAKAPDKDGPVAITLYLKDDLNNLSEPVLLDSIMYDNTKPTVSLRADIGDFVNANGDAVLHASNDQVISQILKVDIGEANVDDAGSGIRRMEIHVTKDGNEVAEPLDPTNFKVKYAPSSIAEPKPTSEGIRDIAIDADDIASTANIKVFNVTDANKITDGTLFIYGIKLGDADGTYQISIDLYDSALNKTPETDLKLHRGATTNFARDTTDPVINKVQVLGAQARKVYSQNEETWWMPIENQDIETLSRVTIKLDISETGSGIKYIKLGKNIEFTSASKIKYGDTTLVQDTEYTLDVANNTIELLNWFTPVLKDNNAKVITLENVKLNNPDATEGNEIAITADDFVSKTSGAKTEFFYNDTISGNVIYADTLKPAITTLEIEDSAQKSETNPHSLGYNKKYTDNQNVTLILKLTAENLHNGSGVKTIHLSENAEFTNNTQIFVDDVQLTSGYEFAADKKSVSFEKVFTEANEIKFTNTYIVSNTEGTQTVKAYLTDFVGLENESKESDAIILDQVAPVITNIEWVAPEGIAKGSANSNEVKDQTFKVDFTEETSGARVIKFDIDFEKDPAGTPSYDKPFDLNEFELYYNNSVVPLIKGTDYEIKNNRYILLKNPKIATAGTFSFKNLQLRDSASEGKYDIKVTLLDQAENINPQTEDSIFSKKIFIDTTVPVVSKVQVVGAEKRSVYGNSADTKQWWMPYSYFDEANDLNKVSFVINVNEEGSGIKVIQLSDDVEFTDATELYVDTTKLGKDTEYTLDTVNHTIILKDYEDPKLRGKPSVFTLQNIKFKNINSDAGNKVGFAVEDWVTNTGNNGNKVYYPDGTDGTFIYADSEKPAIATLKIEDSAHNAETNPDTKAWDKENYTDSQKVILTLKLAAENTNFGSGVKIIHLSDNAEFTDGSTISVDGTPLTSGYHFATDKKSVEFDKVFVADNEIKFTNVNILNTTDGTQSVKAKLTDFVGLEAEVKTSDNSLIVDKVNPEVSTVEWIPDNETLTTAGTTNRATIDDQTFKVTFTEATAGVKVIKFDINYENENSTYANPFDFENLEVYYDGNETALLTKNVDYTVDGRYIILNETCKSNSFRFHGIKLKGTDFAEGTYTVKVTLQDAAERIGTKSDTISIDTTEPVIVGDLRIPDLVQAVELTTEGTPVTNNYWLKKDYVNGTSGATGDTAQAPNRIPVYFTVKEKSSGVKVITFSEDVVLTSDTKLYVLNASDPSEEKTASRTEITRDQYRLGSDNRTISITNKNDSKQYFTKYNAAGEEIPFILLFENVSFKNADSNISASVHTISVTLSDVAKNSKTTSTATTAVANIYSDSRAPAAPENLTLKDRENPAVTDVIRASNGYTKESIVDMTFSLPASEQFGSGYHQFVLTGATFKNVGENNTDNTTNIATNATTVTMLSGSSEIKNIAFDISEDGKTLTLRKYGQAATEEAKAVVRKAVSVTIKNVHLDNADTDGSHDVTLTAYDLTGWKSTSSSANITLDTKKPELAKGVFTANYTKSDRTYYQPTINVYPHVNTASGHTEDATGVNINYGTQSNPKNVPTFYTATTYNSGYSQINGEVSSSDSSLNKNFIHGAVLGFRAKDNISLSGWVREKTFLYWILDSDFSKSKEQIISGGTNSTWDIGTYRTARTDSSSSSETNAVLWFGFSTGKYSAVIIDEAGNCSDIFHFAIVQDTTKPDKSTTSGNTNNLNERVLLQMPDNSAKAYTKQPVSKLAAGDLSRFYAYGSSTTYFRTKKYVTKKTSNKYKIVLKLGGTYTSSYPVTNIDGTTPGTSLKYAGLDATKDSSPIEKYAISTYYSSWPINETSTYPYEPVVPYGTTFPSGETHTSNSTALGRDYFEYSNGYYTDSYWRSPSPSSSSTLSWHDYKNSTSVTDTMTGISSYVDSNSNLVIEIPNNQNKVIPPISVFLRDGCGNMQYVVCGLYKDNGYDVAISFEVDERLGYATTTNGQLTTPIVMQNPYMTYVSSSPSVNWPSSESTSGFNWNNNTGNGDQGGEGAKRGFIRDYVKYATYYNPSIWSNTLHEGSSYDTQKVKIGLTLNFDTRNYQRGYPESILFDSSLGKVSNPDPLSSTSGDYTCRALLYCTQSDSKPSYDEIISANANVKNSYGGFRTEWVGLRTSNDTSERDDSTEEAPKYKITGSTILLDYPTPDYSTLGWDTSDSNGEPKPYYIWYIFEDRVGNYEIAKIVNSDASGSDLTGTKSGMFDRWFYDGEAPKLTIRGSKTTTNPNGTSPSSITAANIGQLVATNNGFVPYAKNGTVYVHSNYDNSGVRSGGSRNTTIGNGTTLVVDGSDYESKTIYNPFFDLEVSERTGIRAFAWSTSNDVTFTTSTTDYGKHYYDTYNYWYIGWQSTSLTKDIGESWSYNQKTTNAYYGSGSNYSGKYSGLKVNTVVPYGKIKTSDNELWLHVIDWTGNISSYKMGSSLKFRDDSTAPDYTSSGFTGITKTDEYYISKDTSSNPVVRIAGNGTKAKARQDIQLYIPKDYFTDNGAGIKGYTFSNGVSYADSDNDGPYLNLTSSKYLEDGTLTYKVYDNVGNYKEKDISLIFDNTPPSISSVSIVIKESTNNVNKFVDTEFGLGNKTDSDGVTHDDWHFDAFRDYQPKKKTGESKGYTAAHDSLSDVPAEVIQEIYINKTDVAKFHVNLAEAASDINDVIVNKWNATTSKWETLTSINENASSWKYGTSKTTATTFSMGSGDTYGYTLTYDANGTYYQIVVTDLAGNQCCQYFKLYLDNQGPVLATRSDSTSINPTIKPGMGSIGGIKVGTGSSAVTTYYYTAKDEDGKRLTVKFAMSDAGMKNSKQKFYYSFDNSTWTEIESPTDGSTDVTASISSGDIENIYFKDILGNPSTIIPGSGSTADFAGYIYNYTNVNNVNLTKTMTKLTYLNTKPATPTFKAGESDATIVTTGSTDASPASWDYGKTSVLDTEHPNTIAINGKNQRQLKIEFTKSDMVIGYLVTDGNGNLIKNSKFEKGKQYGQTIYIQTVVDSYLSDEYKEAAGSYDFRTDLPTKFKETLPLLINNGSNTSYAQTIRKYYAVDVVGNISDPLTLTYTYSNPTHQATDIHLIRSLDEIEASDVKTNITTAVTNGTLKLATIADLVEGEGSNKKTTRFFNGDWLLLSCTLSKKATSTNNDTPAKVELVDIWGGAAAGNATRGYAAGDNIKIYASTQTNSSDRYYCYVAFKVGKDKDGTWTHEEFDNNDQWGGSQLYAKVVGKNGTESDSYLLNPQNEIDIRWKRDIKAPDISGTYIDASRLHNYKASSDNIFIVIDNENADWTGTSNAYPRGLAIYLPKAAVTDGFQYTGDAGSIQSNTFVTYAGVSQYKTVIGSGDSAIDSGWKNFGSESINWDGTDTDCYKIQLPDVETVHKEITLYIKDSVGNATSCKIGNSDEAGSLWWIVNDLFTKKSKVENGEVILVDADAPTMTAPTWTADAQDYTFEVTVPAGSIIKSVVAKVDGTVVTDAVVSFKDYTTNSTTLNGTQGYLNLSGIDVKLNKIEQKWTAQGVQIIINGDESKALTAENFVPKKQLSSTDVQIGTADWNKDAVSYEIPLTFLTEGASKNNISTLSVNVEGMTAALSSTENKVILTGSAPTQTWEDQPVKLTINGSIEQTVITVPSKTLTAADISVTASAYDSSKDPNTYNLTITTSEQSGAPISKITDISGINGTVSNLTRDEEHNKITVTLSPVAQKLTEQVVSLKFNNSDELIKKIATGSGTEFTITPRALAKSDLTVTAEAKDGKYEYTITVNETGSDNLNSLITSVTPDNATTETAEGSDGITRDNNTISFTLVPVAAGWESKTISVKINNSFDLSETFTIDAKSFTADNIIVTVGDPTDNVYPLTITTTDNAPITKITKIEASEGTLGTDWTHDSENNKIVASLTIDAGYTDKSINLTFNKPAEGDGLVKEITILAKELTASAFVITSDDDKPLSWSPDANTTYVGIKIVPPEGITLTGDATVSSELTTNSAELPTIQYNYNNQFGIQVAKVDDQNKTMPTDLKVTVKVNVGESTKEITITLNNLDGDGRPKAPGAANNPRSIFGIRSGAIAYNSTATENAGDAPKTRRVSLTSWVSDLFNNDSEVAAETVKDEVKSTTAKAAKKAKKAQKAAAAKAEKAPVEKPVITETVETVSVTSAAAVSEVVETVTETVANEGTIATVEEAAPEAKVSMTVVDASVTESVADDQAQSGAILWLALAALCAAVVGIMVIILKNRAAKK